MQEYVSTGTASTYHLSQSKVSHGFPERHAHAHAQPSKDTRTPRCNDGLPVRVSDCRPTTQYAMVSTLHGWQGDPGTRGRNHCCTGGKAVAHTSTDMYAYMATDT